MEAGYSSQVVASQELIFITGNDGGGGGVFNACPAHAARNNIPAYKM